MSELASAPTTRSARRPGVDVGVETACALAGLAATVLVALGFVVVAGFIPPPDPAAPAEEISRLFAENTGSIRTGMILTMIGFSCFVPYGCSIATVLRGGEPRPVLAHVQVASVAIATLFAVMTTFIWSTAAFRPDELPADTTRMLNDLSWFCFLFTIPPFTVWIAAIGVAVLRDRRAEPALPRWAGYLNLWVAILILPGMMMTYVKDGPFAFDGVIALYVPFGAFFTWILVMTPLLLGAVRREGATA